MAEVTNGELLVELRALRDDVGAVRDDVREVKAEAKKTNGRLRTLELWRHGLEAAAKANSWVRPAAIAFVTGAGLTVLGFFLNATG